MVYKIKKRSYKKLVILVTIIFLVGLGIFWFKYFNNNSTTSKIKKVNNIISKIYMLQLKVNQNNDKTKNKVISSLNSIENDLNNLNLSKNNMLILKNIKSEKDKLRQLIQSLKRNWINMNINISTINTINYTKLISDIDIIKNNIINNYYNKKIELWNTSTSTNTNQNIEISKTKEKTTNISAKEIIPADTDNLDNNLDNLGLSSSQIKILKDIKNNKINIKEKN